MPNKIVFGKWEAVTVLINVICAKVFLNFPRKVAEDAGTAGWLMTIYVSLLAFLGFFIIARLYKRYEGKDLIDLGEHIGGSIGRILVGSIVIGFLVFMASLYLREFGENMKEITLTVSPLSFVIMFFAVGMIVAAYVGLEAIVRYHALAVPIIATGFFIILIAVLPLADFRNITPILGMGAYEIFVSGFFKISLFGELLIIFLLIPFLQTHDNFVKAGYTALGFSSFFLFISALVYLAVVDYPVTIESFLPIHRLATLINIGRFFQRIESIFVLIWALAGLLYISTAFFFAVYIFKKTFKLEYYRPLILPFAVLVFNLSFLPPNLMTAVVLETKYFRTWAWVATFLMPIVLLVMARLIKRPFKKAGEISME
jgi:spore germination protein (amino acid permease)